ncbi:uncharacterized protein G2W53_017452 [Senna tora]|uniref:Uncharacterized protein n=1 Tax=Senna tora TaxID=362788 RepID=A0A834TP92_9FABA|nr:uncharacterized protein G2W53_017452 [Senna tora]
MFARRRAHENLTTESSWKLQNTVHEWEWKIHNSPQNNLHSEFPILTQETRYEISLTCPVLKLEAPRQLPRAAAPSSVLPPQASKSNTEQRTPPEFVYQCEWKCPYEILGRKWSKVTMNEAILDEE